MHQRKHTPNKEEMVAINNNGSGGGRKIKQHLFSTKKTMPMIVIVIIIIIMTVVITNQTPQGKKRLEFVHITKTAGSSIEKAATLQGINWGACHWMAFEEVGCLTPDIKDYVAPDYQSYALTSPWHTPPKILIERVKSPSEHPYGNDATLFAVVRNPYDRALSEYYCPWTGYKRSNKNEAGALNMWLKNKVTNVEKVLKDYAQKTEEERNVVQGPDLNEDEWDLSQKHFVNQAEYVYDGDRQIIDHVLHYETLEKDFAKLMTAYELTNVKLPDKSHGVYSKDTKKLTYLDLDDETIALINRYAEPDFKKFGYEMVTSFKNKRDYSLAPISKRG